MCERTVAEWALGAALAFAALQGTAQEDGGPILRPHKPLVNQKSATILVTCDLECSWKLDGEAEGRIEAGGAAKIKVGLGQHLVFAETKDGADQTQQFGEVKTNRQLVVNLNLKTARETRLIAEKEASDKHANDARAKAELEARENAELRAREKVASEEAAGVWTDPATGLMWTKQDNGTDLTWQGAVVYCRDLQLAGHGGWRLPTLAELHGIYDKNLNDGTFHVKGNLALTGWEWSNQGNAAGDAWSFYFNNGEAYHVGTLANSTRALCVRRAGD